MKSLRLPVSAKDIPFPEGECLARIGPGKDDPLFSELLEKVKKTLRPSVIYREVCVEIEERTVKLPFCRLESRDLSRALSGCRSVYLLALTLGHDTERAIARLSVTSQLSGFLADGIGSVFAEGLAERATALLRALPENRERRILPRFSPGYGDLPLTLQAPLLEALSAAEIGITLSRSLLMTPKKSVTALLGIQENEERR